MTKYNRTLTESRKKNIAAKQRFKCANKPNSDINGLEKYECHLWKDNSSNKGCFDEEGYEIDHIEEHCINGNDEDDNLQALCKSCHAVKTKRFMTNKKNKPNKPSDKKSTNQLTYRELQYICKENGAKSNMKRETLEMIVNDIKNGKKVDKEYLSVKHPDYNSSVIDNFASNVQSFFKRFFN